MGKRVSNITGNLDEASKIQIEAEAFIDEDNLLDAYYKYRACYLLMGEVLEKCPASYKPDAMDSVEFAKFKVEGLHMLLKMSSTNEITSAVDATHHLGFQSPHEPDASSLEHREGLEGHCG